MKHVVLLGDSIFDNAVYVPNEPAVIKQLQKHLPSFWQTTLFAVDGDVTEDILKQTKNLPKTATHLILSCGGNDALRRSSILGKRLTLWQKDLKLLHYLGQSFEKVIKKL